jgi:hypothetical protein
LLRSALFSKLATRRNCAATCGPDHLRVCAPCHRRPRLDVARRRSGAAAVCVRPHASVRGRPASRCRSRRSERRSCARSGGGNGLVRWDGADRRQDGVDRDAVRLHRHARAPRVDRGGARCARRGGLGRRYGRTERRGRLDGALRLFRHTHDERSTGVRRSADLAASPPCWSRRFCRDCSLARRSARSGGGYASRPGDVNGRTRVDREPDSRERAEQRLSAKHAGELGSVSCRGDDGAGGRRPPRSGDSASELAGRFRRGCVRVRDGEAGTRAYGLAHAERSDDVAG